MKKHTNTFILLIFLILFSMYKAFAGDGSWTTYPRLYPSERRETPAVEINNKIYVYGGVKFDEQYGSDLWVYDIALNKWSEIQQQGVTPGPLVHPDGCVVINEKMYIIGGIKQYGISLPGEHNAIWVYDPATNHWTKDFEGAPLTSYYNSAVRAYGNKIYIFGGIKIGFGYTNDLWVYDTVAKSWNQLSPLGSLPSARNSPSIAIDNNKIYMFGGSAYGEPIIRLNDFWQYDILANTWIQLSPVGAVPDAQPQANMNIVNGKIVMFSSEDATSVLRKLWIYDINGNAWTDATDTATGVRPTKESYISSMVINGEIYYYGNGLSPSYGRAVCGWICQLWKYNISNNEWVYIIPDNVPSIGRKNASVSTVGSRLYIFGGQSNATYQNDISSFEPATGKWVQLEPIGLKPPPRAAHSACVLGEKIYIFGGDTIGVDDLNDLWVYDTVANTWTELFPAGTLPDDHYGHFAFNINGDMYVFGNSLYTTFWRYDIAANAWTKIIPTGDVPTYSWDICQAVYVNGKIYMFGDASSLWIYDPSTNIMQQQAPAIGPGSGSLVNFIGVNNLIYCFGGFNYNNDIWRFDTNTKIWKKLNPSGTLPDGRWGYAAGVLNDNLYIFSGYSEVVQDIGWYYTNDMWIYQGSMPPVVSAVATPDAGSAILDVTFTVTATDDGQIVKYEWDFNGDGTFDWNSEVTGNTVFAYTATGVYTAVVRVTDDDGFTATANVTITVSSLDPPEITAIAADPNIGDVPLEINLTATVVAGSGAITKYEWDFDSDGVVDWNSSDDPNTKHTYSEEGTYTATLKVTDENGLTATAGVQITLTKGSVPTPDPSPNPAPDTPDPNADPEDYIEPVDTDVPPKVTALITTPIPICVGDSVGFSGTTVVAEGKTIVLYEWDFDGDGNYDWSSDSTINAYKTFSDEASYTAKVRVTDSRGLTGEATVSFSTVLPETLKVWIIQPLEGASISGSGLSIHANTAPGDMTLHVQFYYRQKGTEEWFDINGITYPSPYSFITVWDTLNLENASSIELKAVATSLTGDRVGSEIVNVRVDAVNPDEYEEYVEGYSNRRQKITPNGGNVLTASGVSLEIPHGAVKTDALLNIKELGENNIKTSNKVTHGPIRNIYLENGGQPEKGCVVTLPYADKNNDGILDNTLVSVENLKIYHHDIKTNKWTVLPDSKINTEEKVVIGTTESFSYFVLGWADPGSVTVLSGPINSGFTSSSSSSSSGGGCFVATSAFERDSGNNLVRNFTGEYLLPARRLKKLNKLRKFRDDVLMKRRAGRQVVRMYYTLGPVAAEAIRDKEPLKSIVRDFILSKSK